MRKIIDHVAPVLGSAVFALFIVWLALNWAARCGQIFYVPHPTLGIVETNGVCVLMPWADETDSWAIFQ